MSTDEYVPEEDDVRMAYIEAHVDMADPITRRQRAQAEREAEDAWAAFLARVRRDAAREALDGLAIDLAVTSGYTEAEEVRDYRDAHYPEETR